MSDLLVLDGGVLMPRRADVQHDWQTISTYPEYVAMECTCGNHAPPVGLCEIPSAHIEYCAFRTNRTRNIKDINQTLIENNSVLSCATTN